MWVFIFGFAIILFAAGFAYITGRVYRLLPAEKRLVPGYKRRLRVFAAVGIVLVAVLFFAVVLGYINAAIVVIHLPVFWLLSDLLFFLIKKITGKRLFRLSSCVAVVATFVYLTVGFVLANNVWVTHYDVYTDKQVGNLRIVMFADSHVGTTFSGAEFGEYVKRMQSYDPDIVIIAGDYVDDDTSREDMIDACAALGTLKTTYGVYYAFGNHDKGYYADSHRNYSTEDLISQLQKNSITLLQDQYTLIDGRFYIIGRQEAEEHRRGSARAQISDLTKDIDKSDYSVVIDHQPTDYDNESAAGVDLVLSGHTHGGQMFPIGLISDMFGLNDRVYGMEKRGDTHFIVTSGISDWAFKFKTGCSSEFVVIDIHGN